MWTSCTTALFLIYGLILSGVVLAQELTSTLHFQDESGKHYAYVGENVTFTCMIRGRTIAWSSDEYIGTDNQRVEFSYAEPEGTTRKPSIDNGWTVAELSRTTSFVDGMVSKLHIIIQSLDVFQNSSITCRDVGNDLSDNISFNVERNISATCDKTVVCPGEQVTCTCTTAHSNALAWIGGQFFEDRIELLSTNYVNFTREDPDGGASAVLTHNSAQNGVRVMKASLTFNVPESITSDNITCQNIGEAVPAHVPIAIPDECTTTTKASTTTTTTNDEDTDTTSTDHTGSAGKDNYTKFLYIGIGTIGAIVIVIIICCGCPSIRKWILRKLGVSEEPGAGGDNDGNGNGVNNEQNARADRSEPTEGSQQSTNESNGEDKKDSPEEVVVTKVELHAQPTEFEKMDGNQQSTNESNGEDKKDSPEEVVVTKLEFQAQLAEIKKMVESRSESEAKKRESAIQEVREEGQREREKMAKELRAHEKEIDGMNKRFEELENKRQKMFEHVEEVERDKQRQLKEMEEKFRTERQSEVDELSTQIAKLRDEVKKLKETCERLRELDQKKQKKVEKLEQELQSTRRTLEDYVNKEQELPSTRRTLEDSMNKQNDSGVRRRKGHDGKHTNITKQYKDDSTQIGAFSTLPNLDVMFEAIKNCKREQIEVAKEVLSEAVNLLENQLTTMQ